MIPWTSRVDFEKIKYALSSCNTLKGRRHLREILLQVENVTICKLDETVLTAMNNGEHSLSFGGLYGGGRGSGVWRVFPLLSNTKRSETCILSF